MNRKLPANYQKLIEFSQLRQKRLELGCNENVLSATANSVLGSPAASRYYFKSNNRNLSDFPEFAASGYPDIDEVLEQAKRDVMAMTGAGYVNFAPLSGIHAMLMVMVSLTKPGDIILSLDSSRHGHFATRSVIEQLGRKSVYIPRLENGQIDNAKVGKLIQEGATMLYLDLATHLEPISITETKRMFGEHLITVFDASHTLGLIMGGRFHDPFHDGVDVICANTHKTLPGPHRGIIMARNYEIGERIAEGVDGKLYSSVHFGSLLALAITIFEMKEFGREYAQAIIDNSVQLTQSLEEEGFVMGRRYSGDLAGNQHVHINYPDRADAYKVMTALLENNIVSQLCYAQGEEFIVRFGTQEVTRRGMSVKDMKVIAPIIKRGSQGVDVRKKVEALVSQFPSIKYSFDTVA